MLLRESNPTANKEHFCSNCGQTISQGTKYKQYRLYLNYKLHQYFKVCETENCITEVEQRIETIAKNKWERLRRET